MQIKKTAKRKTDQRQQYFESIPLQIILLAEFQIIEGDFIIPLSQNENLFRRVYDLNYTKLKSNRVNKHYLFHQVELARRQNFRNFSQIKQQAQFGKETLSCISHVEQFIKLNKLKREQSIQRLRQTRSREMIRNFKLSIKQLEDSFEQRMDETIRSRCTRFVKYTIWVLDIKLNCMKLSYKGFSQPLLDIYFGEQPKNLFSHVPVFTSLLKYEQLLYFFLHKIIDPNFRDMGHKGQFLTIEGEPISYLMQQDCVSIAPNDLMFQKIAWISFFHIEQTDLIALSHKRKLNYSRGLVMDIGREKQSESITRFLPEPIPKTVQVSLLS